VKNLIGRNDIGDALKRLDKLTQEEAQMAIAETLKISHDLVVRQLRQELQRWLSPPDPSTNHNIARKCHHQGTTTWFFQTSIYEKWKSTPSLLWVHGKRMLSLRPTALHLMTSCPYSWLWKEHPQVRFSSSIVTLAEDIDQLCNYRRDHDPLQCGISFHGLFLFRLS
jgi:hypothetical protein